MSKSSNFTDSVEGRENGTGEGTESEGITQLWNWRRVSSRTQRQLGVARTTTDGAGAARGKGEER